MEFKEAVKIALQSLWANKLRSVLTLLGVVIGVASVIAVVTLVNGANTYVTTKFTTYGADVFTVSRMPAIITNSCRLRALPEAQEHPLRRLPVREGQLQELRRDRRTAGDHGEGGARHAVHYRLPDSRLYVADAVRCRT